MSRRLKTPEGKTLYALRKQMPEPVFGIIKEMLGIRPFCCLAGVCLRRMELGIHGVDPERMSPLQPRLRGAPIAVVALAAPSTLLDDKNGV